MYSCSQLLPGLYQHSSTCMVVRLPQGLLVCHVYNIWFWYSVFLARIHSVLRKHVWKKSSLTIKWCKFIAVPSTYQYLGDQSILFPMVGIVIASGRSSDTDLQQIKVVLRSVLNGAKQPLPPLNWPSVLSPLLRTQLGNASLHCCFSRV